MTKKKIIGGLNKLEGTFNSGTHRLDGVSDFIYAQYDVETHEDPKLTKKQFTLYRFFNINKYKNKSFNLPISIDANKIKTIFLFGYRDDNVDKTFFVKKSKDIITTDFIKKKIGLILFDLHNNNNNNNSKTEIILVHYNDPTNGGLYIIFNMTGFDNNYNKLEKYLLSSPSDFIDDNNLTKKLKFSYLKNLIQFTDKYLDNQISYIGLKTHFLLDLLFPNKVEKLVAEKTTEKVSSQKISDTPQQDIDNLKENISYNELENKFGKDKLENALKTAKIDKAEYERLLNLIDGQTIGGGNIKKIKIIEGGGLTKEDLEKLIIVFKTLSNDPDVENKNFAKRKLEKISKTLGAEEAAKGQAETEAAEAKAAQEKAAVAATHVVEVAKAEASAKQLDAPISAVEASKEKNQLKTLFLLGLLFPNNIKAVEASVSAETALVALAGEKETAEKFKDINPIIYNMAIIGKIFNDDKFNLIHEKIATAEAAEAAAAAAEAAKAEAKAAKAFASAFAASAKAEAEAAKAEAEAAKQAALAAAESAEAANKSNIDLLDDYDSIVNTLSNKRYYLTIFLTPKLENVNKVVNEAKIAATEAKTARETAEAAEAKAKAAAEAAEAKAKAAAEAAEAAEATEAAEVVIAAAAAAKAAAAEAKAAAEEAKVAEVKAAKASEKTVEAAAEALEAAKGDVAKAAKAAEAAKTAAEAAKNSYNKLFPNIKLILKELRNKKLSQEIIISIRESLQKEVIKAQTAQKAAEAAEAVAAKAAETEAASAAEAAEALAKAAKGQAEAELAKAAAADAEEAVAKALEAAKGDVAKAAAESAEAAKAAAKAAAESAEAAKNSNMNLLFNFKLIKQKFVENEVSPETKNSIEKILQKEVAKAAEAEQKAEEAKVKAETAQQVAETEAAKAGDVKKLAEAAQQAAATKVAAEEAAKGQAEAEVAKAAAAETKAAEEKATVVATHVVEVAKAEASAKQAASAAAESAEAAKESIYDLFAKFKLILNELKNKKVSQEIIRSIRESLQKESTKGQSAEAEAAKESEIAINAAETAKVAAQQVASAASAAEAKAKAGATKTAEAKAKEAEAKAAAAAKTTANVAEEAVKKALEAAKGDVAKAAVKKAVEVAEAAKAAKK